MKYLRPDCGLSRSHNDGIDVGLHMWFSQKQAVMLVLNFHFFRVWLGLRWSAPISGCVFYEDER